MVVLGIISDTHITHEDDMNKVKALLEQIKLAFKDVDEIIHAGDVCDDAFLIELNKIAPTRCVLGNMDHTSNREEFITFSIGSYKFGVIHKPPQDMEQFFKEHGLNILIHGHTHQPIIQGTPYNTLIINPGSPTKPKAPPQKRGFMKPVARPSVIKLKIDENDMISTFIINLKT